MTKILYAFPHSIWAHAAELAVAELGYKEGDITVKIVNLIEGENFAPWFLKLNPNGTLPTLESDGQVYKTTAEVTSALIKDAPTKVKAGSTVIETIHADKYDPNLLVVASRNDAELTAKSDGIFGAYFSNRQAVLEKLSVDPEAAAYKDFYETKKGENGGLLPLFTGKASEEQKAGFFALSQAHLDSIKGALFEVLPGFLPASGFIGGEVPGEDDFHVGAWLTRVADASGGKSADDALAAIEGAYGAPVPGKVSAYWGAWTARASWKKVHAAGLH
ncbi:hypothetical protein K438DRAFT_1089445 [Mycena galopus ATCC 62051]|nr:hypothetical protein K438DRAFT_1089445 [Mycena galopus ATCC 62051]